MYEQNTKIMPPESYPILLDGEIFTNINQIKDKYPLKWEEIARSIQMSGTEIINQ